MSVEDNLPSGNDDSPEGEQFQGTKHIQQALEQLVDNESAVLPHLEHVPSPQASQGEREESTPIHDWFFTFMCMNIPLIGWIYLISLAFSKKQTERKNFARAYLFYKLLFLMIGIVLLGILLYIGLDMIDQILAYMEML